ncbi:MAG: prolyl oligopeptidase family serine peptidase [Acidobacteriota bacterium]
MFFRRATVISAACLVLALFCTPLPAKSKASEQRKPLTQWLTAGPFAVRQPAYGGQTGKKTDERLLGPDSLGPESLWPEAGLEMIWSPSARGKWTAVHTSQGKIDFGAVKGKSIAYALTYLHPSRWEKLTLEISHPFPVAIYLDGKKERFAEPSPRGAATSVDLILRRGAHRLMIAAVLPKDGASNMSVALAGAGNGRSLPESALNPEHLLALRDVEAAENFGGLALSKDGALTADIVHRIDRAKDAWEEFLEIRQTRSGKIIANYKVLPGSGNASFSPDSRMVAFTAPDPDKKGTEDLWLLNLDRGTMGCALKEKRGLKRLIFSPNSRFLYFIATAPRKRPEKPPRYVRFTQMYQRWTGWEDRPQIFVLSLADHTLHQLTAGQTNVIDFDLSRDGKRIALVRNVFVEHRPYLVAQVWTYDVASGKAARVLAWNRWPDLSQITWSPDGKKLALIAPPADMPPGGLKPAEQLAYDLDLYVIDLSSRSVRKITTNFKPTVGLDLIGARAGERNLWWNPGQTGLYFVATDQQRSELWRTDAAGSRFQLVNLPDAVESSPAMSSSGNTYAWVGATFGHFWTLRAADLQTGKVHDVARPGEKVWSRVRLTKHEAFNFTDKAGVPIKGWLFLPSDLDARKKYPLVVAYYGGAVPFAEGFRPQLFWLAANGYVVYLVTPRGAVGYGKAFADDHVNDWGKKAGADIIQGVKKLVASKSFIDSSRIGCYGGSYGGFRFLRDQ